MGTLFQQRVFKWRQQEKLVAMTEPGARISVALVDDQPLFLAGIRMLIESQSDMQFCGDAANGEQAVALASERRPDVMLMDLRMPVMDGVAATRRIISEADACNSDRPRIIALTTFNRDHAVLDAVQAGARGYLLKSAEPEFLLAAIRTVHSGYSVIAPGSVHSLFEHAANRGPSIGPDLSVLDVLSVREREVFLLVAKGLSNRDVAEALFISDATVKTHLRSVLDKLALRTRLQLIAYAHERRLLGD
jgi:DNA-binding NarL/FixJ family response regulator